MTVLVLTHKGTDGKPLTPHLEWLKRTNPDADVRLVVGEDSPHGKRYNWKNGDQPLRQWWQDNGHTVESDIVHVIEWDTLVAYKLPALPDYLDLGGRELMTPGQGSPWIWFRETDKLGLRDGEKPCGLVSFGAFVMRRGVLDAVCKPRWDAVYADSIQNELRFPSVAAAEGFRVGEVFLPFVRWTKVKVGEVAGIYHSIKQPFTGTFTNTAPHPPL